MRKPKKRRYWMDTIPLRQDEVSIAIEAASLRFACFNPRVKKLKPIPEAGGEILDDEDEAWTISCYLPSRTGMQDYISGWLEAHVLVNMAKKDPSGAKMMMARLNAQDREYCVPKIKARGAIPAGVGSDGRLLSRVKRVPRTNT